MNALDLIENEFKVLLNEMKKRYANIKDVNILVSQISSKWTKHLERFSSARAKTKHTVLSFSYKENLRLTILMV